MIISHISLHQYQIPLTRPLPVGIQRIDKREGLVLSVTAEKDQQTHYIQVEISPLSGQDIDGAPLRGFSLETLMETKQALTKIGKQLLGENIESLLKAANESELPSVSYGLSLAYYQASGSVPKARVIPKAIPLIYRIEDEPIALFNQRLDNLDDSIATVKVKVAQTSMQQELELVYQILARKPQLRIRLDANRGFELDTAIEFTASLPLSSIDYIEEPCINPHDNIILFNTTGIPYALDESLNQPHYMFTPVPGLAALVIKPMILGSLDKLQALVDEAEKHGVKAVLSSSLEASLGIQAIIDLSATLTPDEAPGIDTLNAFSADLIAVTNKKICLNLDKLTVIFELNQQ